HLRPLAALPADKRAEAYQEAQGKADGNLTASKVQEAVNARLAESPPAESTESSSVDKPATELVGFEEDDQQSDVFQTNDEIKEAFKIVLAEQEKCSDVEKKHRYNGHLAVVKQARRELSSTQRSFLDRLHRCPSVLICDGEFYVRDFRSWRCVEALDLDEP